MILLFSGRAAKTTFFTFFRNQYLIRVLFFPILVFREPLFFTTMENLSNNWVFEGHIDFEYKKYLLLAYVQRCQQQFGESRLYPPLGELVQHYRNLNDLKESFQHLNDTFPKEFTGFDFNKLQLMYEQKLAQDLLFSTITEIVDFALPNIQHALEEGKEIYEFVETNIEITPLGIIPVYNREGYLLINTDNSDDVHVYGYHHSIISTTADNMHSLKLDYLCKETRSISNTFDHIKSNLVRRFRELPNPAAYLCMSKMSFPLLETLLPVTRRLLLRHVVS